MAEAASAAESAPLLNGLPDAIVIWEILVRLPTKSLLRCRAVCPAWRRGTSTRNFLLAHHARQPNLPIISVGRNLLADDQLHTIARLDKVFYPQASCEGLLVLIRYAGVDTRFSICNPATRQHAPLGMASNLGIMGMYSHHPTAEYRLLMHRRTWVPAAADMVLEGPIGCYVYALGSDLPPRYMGWPETAPRYLELDLPALLRDKLHWFTSHCRAVIVFDTIAETFRQMRAPIAPSGSCIFEMDGTLGIYKRDTRTEIVDIWVLQDYESEVWGFKYRIELPVAEIKGRFEGCDNCWDMNVVSGDGGVLLLVSFGRWLLHIDSDGKLVDSFHRGAQGLRLNGLRLKQTLVPHTFFCTPSFRWLLHIDSDAHTSVAVSSSNIVAASWSSTQAWAAHCRPSDSMPNIFTTANNEMGYSSWP